MVQDSFVYVASIFRKSVLKIPESNRTYLILHTGLLLSLLYPKLSPTLCVNKKINTSLVEVHKKNRKIINCNEYNKIVIMAFLFFLFFHFFCFKFFDCVILKISPTALETVI